MFTIDVRVHEILSAKPFRAVITTNYDRLTEIHWEKQNKNPFVVIPQNAANIATATQALHASSALTPIIRAHGALNDPNTLILFPRTYREIMFRNDAFRQFMSTIFRQFAVLFVGTSFRDPNFQSLLQCIYTVTEGKEAPHYAILDDKGPVFKNYKRKNYNIELTTFRFRRGSFGLASFARIALTRWLHTRIRQMAQQGAPPDAPKSGAPVSFALGSEKTFGRFLVRLVDFELPQTRYWKSRSLSSVIQQL